MRILGYATPAAAICRMSLANSSTRSGLASQANMKPGAASDEGVEAPSASMKRQAARGEPALQTHDRGKRVL
jgi:hypothetical protein